VTARDEDKISCLSTPISFLLNWLLWDFPVFVVQGRGFLLPRDLPYTWIVFANKMYRSVISVFWDIAPCSLLIVRCPLADSCWFLAWLIYKTLKIEAIFSLETSVDIQRTTRHYIP
jgi:hypothetical protein